MVKNTYKRHKVPVYNKAKQSRVIHKEPMVIREQIDLLSKQIKLLIAQKKALQKQMKAMGQKEIPSSYRERPILLYVLQLEHGCWYIGSTRNMPKRYKDHLGSKGAMWTRANKPLAIHLTRETGLTSDSEAGLLEDELTLEYARLYGTDVVRGGGYCQMKPRWPKEVFEPDLSWAAN